MTTVFFCVTLHLTADRKRHGRQSRFLVAMIVLGLIIGVAALSIVSGTNKVSLYDRVGINSTMYVSAIGILGIA